MFTIDNQFENSRRMPPLPGTDNNATQRVDLNHAAAPRSTVAPQRPTAPASGRTPNRTPQKRRSKFTRKDKTILLSIGCLALVFLVLLGIVSANLFKTEEDNGLILNNVIAAGVKLGGMTPEQAKTALTEATANTYSQLDMKITVVDTVITLSPADTGAKLDVDAVVEEAYNYGRTGSRSEQQQIRAQASTTSYIIDIIPYLNLNTDYIKSAVESLGQQFNSTLSQPSITIVGDRPSLDVTKPDTSVAHQTLKIYMGTAEYGLDTQQLYETILEYYNINIFQVVGQCTVVTPGSLDEKLEALYEENCVAPVDATMDANTYQVTPEVYGYGFDLEQVKEQISNAQYGQTLEIPLTYLAPAITEELLSGDLFKDTLSSFTAKLPDDTAWSKNVTLACQKINGLILRSGEEFSFNSILEELTVQKGWVEASVFQGKKQVNAIGGGATQVAGVLYQCALRAGLDITEVNHHTYAPTFTTLGYDAYTDGGNNDFRFRNTMTDPITINASVSDGQIIISIVGTESRDYQYEIEYLTTKTLKPGTLTNLMQIGNPGGYKDGDILVKPLTGYQVEVYRYTYDGSTGKELDRQCLETITYSARDAVVVQLEKLPEPTEPSEPSEPTDPMEPTDPTETTAPTAPSEPTSSTGATGETQESGSSKKS